MKKTEQDPKQSLKYKIAIFCATNSNMQILKQVIVVYLIPSFFSQKIVKGHGLHKVHLLWITPLISCLCTFASFLFNLPYWCYMYGALRGFNVYFAESFFFSLMSVVSFWCSFFVSRISYKCCKHFGGSVKVYKYLIYGVIFIIISTIFATFAYFRAKRQLKHKVHTVCHQNEQK